MRASLKSWRTSGTFWPPVRAINVPPSTSGNIPNIPTSTGSAGATLFRYAAGANSCAIKSCTNWSSVYVIPGKRSERPFGCALIFRN